MDKDFILNHVDHTVLAQTTTSKDVIALCDDAVKFNTASVCIPSCYVKDAFDHLKKFDTDVKVCTVVGFPNGNASTYAKVEETKKAIEDGADEIDMVINIGKVKEESWDYVLDEIKQIKAACSGKILKVIIETCMLTDEEKIKMCEIVTESGADFIKTSTGFGGAGATFEDVALFKKYVGSAVKIKAAGGISSFDDAEKFIELGADRLGTSRLVKIAKSEL